MLNREKKNKEGDLMISRFLLWILFLGCAFGCSVIPVLGSTVSPDTYSDGVYEGEFKQSPNYARVKVTIEEGRIAEVVLLERGGTRIGDPANDVIPERIIERQSTDVDAVSGATRSSLSIMNATYNAIAKAPRKSKKDILSE